MSRGKSGIGYSKSMKFCWNQTWVKHTSWNCLSYSEEKTNSNVQYTEAQSTQCIYCKKFKFSHHLLTLIPNCMNFSSVKHIRRMLAIKPFWWPLPDLEQKKMMTEFLGKWTIHLDENCIPNHHDSITNHENITYDHRFVHIWPILVNNKELFLFFKYWRITKKGIYMQKS